MQMPFRVALAFLAPALLVYSLIIIYPALNGFYLSLTDSNGVNRANYIGLANYTRMFADSSFTTALRNTVFYAVLVTLMQTVLGLTLALWMGRLPWLRNGARVALFTPGMISALIVAFVWSNIYNPLSGGLNALLSAVGLGGLTRVWLGDPNTALIAVAVVNAWMYSGHSAAIFLANYLSIPPELKESAELDGASGWTLFWYIEWPLLAPATTVNTVITVISALKVFELPFIMTQGGPGGATTVLNLEIYKRAFSGNDFGYGTALTVVLLLLIVGLVLLQTRVLQARELRI